MLLTRALALCDNKQAVAVHINLGDAHRYSGNLVAAEPHYQLALGLAEIHVPGMLSFCLQHLGKQRLDQGRVKEARNLLQTALRQRLAHGDASLVASTRDALRLVDQAESEGT
ncbi:hypothetical protein AB0E67_35100 [Streptomyces sp. NPDC032161]|uniref:hypothetical protein n=1 Tax=unclassified Streptomyces TaxID=2593676 RepID=UPI0033D5E8F9